MVQEQVCNDQNIEEELTELEILDLLRYHRINEILNNFNMFVNSFIEYLPLQFFEMSKTMEKIENLQNLSSEDLNKLAFIYEVAVICKDFSCFYELDHEDNEHKIAEIILDFDIAFWNYNSNAYDSMINDFKLMYGDNVVDDMIELF